MAVVVEFVVLGVPLLAQRVVESDVVAVEDVFAELQADARRERCHQVINLSLLVAQQKNVVVITLRQRNMRQDHHRADDRRQ